MLLKVIGRFGGGLALMAAGVTVGAGVALVPVESGPAGAAAQEIIVNDAADTGLSAANCKPGAETDCQLRGALGEASILGGDVNIELPDPSTVTNNAAAQYQVLSNELGVDDSSGTVTITGAGQASTVIQGQCPSCSVTFQILHVDVNTTAVISGVTVEDGNSTTENGGGIFNGGTLTVQDSTVTNNATSDNGGGIDTQGPLTLTDDTISNNTSVGNGGGVNQESLGTEAMTLTNDTISGNSATDGVEGGGIYISGGTNTFTGNTISDNTVPNAGFGGGIFIAAAASSTNTFSSDTISGNQAQANGNGGGLYIQGGTNTFSGETITGNQAIWVSSGGLGGGVFVSTGTNTFTDGTISDNTAYDGGGVWATFTEATGAVNTFDQETISGNSVTDGGGGIGFETAQSGSTTIAASTISGNNVSGAFGVEFAGDGGGILAADCTALRIVNSTIASNTALDGGGYFGVGCSEPAASTAFAFDTLNGNVGSGAAGIGNVKTTDGSNLTMADSIVAGAVTHGSAGTNCSISAAGSLTSGGYNLFGDASCGTPAATDVTGQNPLLGPLGNNGGPTQTEVPGAGSPAIAGIPGAACTAALTAAGTSTDQRGVTRNTSGSCTIGAVEVGAANNGYRMAGGDGGVFDFNLNFNGSLANTHLNAPIVGLANAPGVNGYLLAGGDGGVFALGGAAFFGSLGGQAIPSPISAIASTPIEDGYWLAARNGTIYHFGNAPAVPAVQLPPGAHLVGIASTSTGKGVWAVDNFGDIYALGDAPYLGGMGGIHINAPVVGISALTSGFGYVLAGADGGVYAFGVGFAGSVPGSLQPGQHLVAPIVGIALTHDGKGYWLAGGDGGLFNYGDATFFGSIYTAIPGRPLNAPIVGIEPLGTLVG